MEVNFKELKTGTKVSTLKVEHNNNRTGNFITESTELELEAIACLLGGYNTYGRKMAVEEFEKHKREFDRIINIVKYSI